MAPKGKPKSKSKPAKSKPVKKGKAKVQDEGTDTEDAGWLPNDDNYDYKSLHRVMLDGNYIIPTYYPTDPDEYDVPETKRAKYALNQNLTVNDAFAKKTSNGVTAWDKHQPPYRLIVDDVYKYDARTGQYLGFTCMEDYRYFVDSAGKS